MANFVIYVIRMNLLCEDSCSFVNFHIYFQDFFLSISFACSMFSFLMFTFIVWVCRISTLPIDRNSSYIFDLDCLPLCWQRPHSMRKETQSPDEQCQSGYHQRPDRNQWEFIVYWLFCVLRFRLFTCFRADRNLYTL